MGRTILLDAGPLDLMTNPNLSSESMAANEWLETMLVHGSQVRIPEISDYEVRRELLRAGKTRGLARLDGLRSRLGYLPITTEVMLKAAEYWAVARQRGRPTAPDPALDCDMILSAQAFVAGLHGDETIIATMNLDHLTRFADARLWQDIK
jgi:predicted nucleic acid-binding protein